MFAEVVPNLDLGGFSITTNVNLAVLGHEQQFCVLPRMILF